MSALRLIALVTARYDWGADRISVGHEEAARLWGTSTRTAKREMARLMDVGLLHRIERGVRGRVGAYRLDPAAIRARTSPVWPRAGAEFASRMEGDLLPPPEVVTAAAPARPVPSAGTVWPSIFPSLAAAHPQRAAAWFSRLQEVEFDGSRLVLRADTAFVAQYVSTHLVGDLRAELRAALGKGVDVAVIA